MHKLPSRLFGLAPALADAAGVFLIASVDLTSEEALDLQPADLADLRSLGMSQGMIEELALRAREPGRRWRIDLKAHVVGELE